jgi:hypothetical protein
MNVWARKLIKKGGPAKSFGLAVLDEDEEKLGRVRSLAATIGLPILDTLVFRLPSDANHLFHAISKQLEGGWNVSFRVMNEDSGALVFRDLDVDVKAVKSELSKLPSGHKFRASISPYKPASISGTLLVRPDDLVLEIVYGPHFWLTKSLPDGVQMFRCCYTAPDVSVRYSTGDAKHRAILHRHLEDITRLALGLNIRHAREAGRPVYAEYIWREDFGYRFLDCSYASVWTTLGCDSRRV